MGWNEPEPITTGEVVKFILIVLALAAFVYIVIVAAFGQGGVIEFFRELDGQGSGLALFLV